MSENGWGQMEHLDPSCPIPCSNMATRAECPATLSKWLLNIFKDGVFTTCAAYTPSLAPHRSASQHSERISCVAVCAHCFMPWHWSSLKRDVVHSLCTLPSSIIYIDEVFLELSHFQAEESQPSQSLLIGKVLQFLHLLITLFWTPYNMSMFWGAQK